MYTWAVNGKSAYVTGDDLVVNQPINPVLYPPGATNELEVTIYVSHPTQLPYSVIRSEETLRIFSFNLPVATSATWSWPSNLEYTVGAQELVVDLQLTTSPNDALVAIQPFEYTGLPSFVTANKISEVLTKLTIQTTSDSDIGTHSF